MNLKPTQNNFESFVKPMMNNLMIKASKADNFIKQSNDNVISKSFLERCKEASKLFNR